MAQAMTNDQRYERSSGGKTRSARYAESDKGLARRRRWADANRPALAKYARERRMDLRVQAELKRRDRAFASMERARKRKKLKK